MRFSFLSVTFKREDRLAVPRFMSTVPEPHPRVLSDTEQCTAVSETACTTGKIAANPCCLSMAQELHYFRRSGTPSCEL